MQRIQRTRTVEWRINWFDEGVAKVAYLGRWRVGRVERVRKGRAIQYVAYLNVPWINGPVAAENSTLAAQMALKSKIIEWLEGFSDDIPDQTETTTRIRRTRG